MLIVFIKAYSKEPSGKERSEEKRRYPAENEPESRPESHVSCRIDERESGRDDDGCSKIGEKGKRGEVLDRATEFACDDGSSCSCGHNKTHKDTLRKDGIA